MTGLLLWTVVVLGVDGPAVAPPPTPGPDGAQAQAAAAEAFADGQRSFAAGEFEAALESFRAAQRAAPHDKVRFNIAQCLLALDRAREAFSEFDAVAASPQLSADERARAKEAAGQAAAKLGTLRFTGADGRTVSVGSLHCVVPCSFDVDAGEHEPALDDGSTLGAHGVTAGATVSIVVPAVEGLTPAGVVAPRVAMGTPVEPAALPAAGDPVPRRAARARPSALMWVGASLAGVGGVGVVAFGLRARTLHAEYLRQPDEDGRAAGVRARNLTNVSIGVAALGGALMVADFVRLAVVNRRR